MIMTRFTSENTMDYILENIPEYRPFWQEHLKNEYRSVLNDLDNFLDFTADQIKNRNYQILPRIFNLIEELNKYGDHDVNYGATMMFLEGLTNISSNRPEEVPYESYLPLLRPKSRYFCRQVDRFWKSRTPFLWTDEEWSKEKIKLNIDQK